MEVAGELSKKRGDGPKGERADFRVRHSTLGRVCRLFSFSFSLAVEVAEMAVALAVVVVRRDGQVGTKLGGRYL